MSIVNHTGRAALKADCLTYADALHREAVRRLPLHHVAQSDVHAIALQGYAVRMTRHFAATCSLIAGGFNDAAAGALRCLLEQHFVFCAIAADASVLQELDHQSNAEKLKALKGLQKLQGDARLSSETYEALDQWVCDWTQRVGEQRGGFNVFDWAMRAGSQDSYMTAYRLLSVRAHGALHALDDYLVLDGAGEYTHIRPDVPDTRVPEWLLLASAVVLNALDTLEPTLRAGTNVASLADLGAQLAGLRKRSDDTYGLAS